MTEASRTHGRITQLQAIPSEILKIIDMISINVVLKEQISNVDYLTGFRTSLEAALMTEKRLKPRSDIEAAMIVVNLDINGSR